MVGFLMGRKGTRGIHMLEEFNSQDGREHGRKIVW